MKLVGVDVGGTFTDVIYTDTVSGIVHIHKVPSTPDDPARAVLDGILGLCTRHAIDPATLEHIYHGTTVATNVVLEAKGATIGLLTTAGYRDIIRIGRHQRPQHYSIAQQIAWQNRELVPRRLRKVVVERVRADGSIEMPLDEDAVVRAAEEFRHAQVRAIAVCFLFSYLYPQHEQRAQAILQECLPGVFVTTSSEVAPQFREFERFTTACMNAYVGPTVRAYITRLDTALGDAGLNADLHIMRSNGGVATPRQITIYPVQTLLSGPAAGVLGGAFSGASAGRDKLITFDVGGTSADIGVITHGTYAEATARDTRIAGFPLLVPMIDIHTIGTGGGSIARMDVAGGFTVGPDSAGAVPGPAAYGNGGCEPTLTDANLVLGRLDATNFLGGEMRLDPAAASAVIGELATRIGLDSLHTAEGIVAVANNDMANAIRARTVQKGLDVRDYALVAFGGGGPLQAAEVARLIGIPEVIVPSYPGINSALGLLTTDLGYDAVRTQFQSSTAIDAGALTAAFDAMHTTLAAQFAADGVAAADITFRRAGDLRYEGQGYELRVPIADGEFSDAALAEIFQAFHRQHADEYGHAFPDNPIEIVNVRLSGTGTVPKLERLPPPAGGDLDAALIRSDQILFRAGTTLTEYTTRIYRRDYLPSGVSLPGPAVILQADSTTLVPPGFDVRVDAAGNLILTDMS